MTLQEFYTRIGGNYDDTLRRIPQRSPRAQVCAVIP